MSHPMTRPDDAAMTTEQEARFWKYVVADPGSGCWLWGGARNSSGYGVFCVERGKSRVSHRALWEHERGLVPCGLTLDHLCRNRACVNPAHLEPVTMRENLMRGVGPSANNARKTHCKHGHALDAANTRLDGLSHRRCRECNRQRCQDRRDCLNALAEKEASR